MKRILLIWIIGLFTVVPFAAYHLLFKAESHQIPLIMFIGFWVFGYAGLVVPLYKAYSLKKIINKVGAGKDLLTVVKDDETRDFAVQSIADRTGIPTHLAEKLYAATSEKLEKTEQNPSDKTNAVNSPESILAFINNNDTKEGAVAMMSRDMRIPKVLAGKIYDAASRKLAKDNQWRSDKAA